MSGFSFGAVREFPWVSCGLFTLTYGAFGWLVGKQVPDWQAWILAHAAWFPWDINGAIATQMGWGFGCFLVLLLMVMLHAPLRILKLLFGSWLRPDAKAIARVLAWAFVVVLIVCWLAQFVRLFVLLAAGILWHLDLQLRGYQTWQIFVILTAIGFLSFAFGGYLFMHVIN